MSPQLDMRALGAMLKKTFIQWNEHDASTHAASLAYYTAFSLAPTLLIAVALAGFIFGEEAAHGEIQRQLSELMGSEAASVVEDMMKSAAKPGSGIVASVIGIAAVLFGATGVFAALQNALNRFWDAPPSKLNGVLAFLRTRFLSFAMVLGIGFLLVVTLVLSAFVVVLGKWLGSHLSPLAAAAQFLDVVISFGMVTVLFAMIYKVLPDVPVAWRDVWLGAAVTALLFELGKLAISLYIGTTSVASSYGAAGSLAVLLTWVYYSAMVLFLGAEFTQVYATSHGSLRGKAKES